jgi:hypothetical protein
MEKVKVYQDTGASLPKDLLEFCEVYQFPYDSADRPKKYPPKVANPCELTWAEAHCTWGEMTFPWGELGSPVPEKIKNLIGIVNKTDYKHLGSALKMGCKVFLTSDKEHIWSKRKEIEEEFGLKIFHLPFETKNLRLFITSLKDCR